MPEVDYGLNEWLMGAPTSLAAIGSPAEIGLGEDNTYIYDGPSVCVHNSLYFINTIEAFGGPIDWWGNSIRHTGGINFFYCDGHSKWQHPGGLQPAGTAYNSGDPLTVTTSPTKIRILAREDVGRVLSGQLAEIRAIIPRAIGGETPAQVEE